MTTDLARTRLRLTLVAADLLDEVARTFVAGEERERDAVAMARRAVRAAVETMGGDR